MRAYAGIGSREISKREVELIHRVAQLMNERGYVLYSGGAPGSDTEFESACEGRGVSFLPWESFAVQRPYPIFEVVRHTKESVESIHKYHPAPDRLSKAAQKLMSRNYFQVNGVDSLPRVDVVICCATPTVDGVSGGTGQAVRIANAAGVQVINLRDPKWERDFHRIPYVERSPLEEIERIVREARGY